MLICNHRYGENLRQSRPKLRMYEVFGNLDDANIVSVYALKILLSNNGKL